MLGKELPHESNLERKVQGILGGIFGFSGVDDVVGVLLACDGCNLVDEL